jgi:L-threonylcarbamoyladenylate synthase
VRIVNTSQINIIINYFKQNGVVCLPTDTIRAFSCSALNHECIERIFIIKQRERDKTLPIFIQDLNMLHKYAFLTNAEERLAADIWPGAVTLVVKAKPNKLSPLLVRDGKIAVRVPADNLIREICGSLDGPIIATSANLSGQKTIVNIQDLSLRMTDIVGLFVESAQKITDRNIESSTIIELVNSNIHVLRQGAKVF